MVRLETIILSSTISIAILFNSGCVAIPMAMVGMDINAPARNQQMENEARKKISNNDQQLIKDIDNVDPYRNTELGRLKEERILEAFRLLDKKGVPYVSANMIVGTPYVKNGKLIGETRGQFYESINIAKIIREINPRVTPVFNLFQPYRGTGLRKDMVAQGLISEGHICGDYRTASGAVGLDGVLSKEELIGIYRSAALYVHFPEDRWKEVREAEKSEDVWEGLVAEASKDYFKDGE